MRVMTILISILFVTTAYAEEQNVKVPVKAGFEKLDMQGFQGAMEADAKAEKSKKKTSIGCTDTSGKSYKQGDQGYDTCLIQTKPLNDKDKGSTTSIQFGN